jgi:tRNA-specific 2-thiouridylase
LAQETGLLNHDRKDSTGICFIGERPFKAFLGRYLPPRPGDIRTLEGESKGQHDGLMYYTIGQRHGLSIGGPGEPWYVVQKDVVRNILYVVQGQDHPALFDTSLQASGVNWISGHKPELPLACHAKIRYRQAEQMCSIERFDSNSIAVRFAEPQRAITPGQSVVFYDNEICIGGGVIAAIPGHDHQQEVTSAR